MKNIVSFFSQINDVPVTHLSDIEPLVYESTSTIKFLVARPAQEVCDLKKYVKIYNDIASCQRFSLNDYSSP